MISLLAKSILTLFYSICFISHVGVSRREIPFISDQSHSVRHSSSSNLKHIHSEGNSSFTIAASTILRPPQSPLTAHHRNTGIGIGEPNETTLPAMSMDNKVQRLCPPHLPCSKLGGECIDCKFNYSCTYGEEITAICTPKPHVECQGSEPFIRTLRCRYCYQTKNQEHSCLKNTTCRVVNAPQQRYITKCMVHSEVLCLGRREFPKNILCNWTKGYSWNVALLLSIVLGGFGVDRFYLGMWQEGIGKLFSFGGLGVWTLVDVILIAVGYLGPADGSLYFQ